MSYKYNYTFASIEADPPPESKTNGLVRRTAFSSGQAVACRDHTPQVVYRRPIGGPGPWLAVNVIYPNGGRYKFTDTDRTAFEAIRVLEALQADNTGTPEGEGVGMAIRQLRNHFRIT